MIASMRRLGNSERKFRTRNPVIASEAKQSIARHNGHMDCFVASAPLRKRFAFVAGNDGVPDMISPSRGAMRPKFSKNFLPKEGAGNAGCTLHPRSRVQTVRKKTHTSIQVQSEHSGIPCAMALRLMPCSPRRRIRLVTVAAGLMADRPGRIDLATGSLAPATGVGTTRFCRTQQRHSSCAPCSLTENRPANTPHAPDAAASTTSHPASVTIAIRPS